MITFSEMPLHENIKKALEQLGFTTPTEIQVKAIPTLIEKPQTDVHAQAQTGTGKTLAFGIPLLHVVDPKVKSVQALIVAPTRELVLQIYESLREIARNTNIFIEPIYGGMPINRQISNIKRGPQIIVGTPGRLNDHLRRKTLSLKALKVLVLDEADIMLDMGFKEEIDEILSHSPESRAIWLFSATVLPGIKELIKSHMHDVLSIRAAAKSTVVSPQVEQYYCIVPSRQRVEAIVRFVEASPDFYGIIFCQTKILTSEVMEKLASKGFKVNCLHGDMKQALRNQVIKGFKNKDFTILVATDVAARGIDVSNLTHVINYSIPEELESYIHRIGRTGRAGKKGTAIVFVAPSERWKIKKLEKTIQIPLQEIAVPTIDAIINLKMNAVSDFIEQAKKPIDRHLSPVHKAIQKVIESFTQEEVFNALTIALEDVFFKDLVHEDLNHITAEIRTAPQEIAIEMGRDTGLHEEILREYLYKTCQLLPQEIMKLRILNKKTFISIPENRLQECLNAMQKTPLHKKHPRIYLVEDVYQEKRPHRQGRAPSRKKFNNRSYRSKK